MRATRDHIRATLDDARSVPGRLPGAPEALFGVDIRDFSPLPSAG